MNREELEYHLETDIANYGKLYKANPDSRWNTPEFAALAADAVRKLQVLQSTKAFWAKTGNTFCKDMKVIANTTDKDFEDFQLNMQKSALQNVPITTLISQAKAQRECGGVEDAATRADAHSNHCLFGRGQDNVPPHGPSHERQVRTFLDLLHNEFRRYVPRADPSPRAGRFRAVGPTPSQHFAGLASHAHIPRDAQDRGGQTYGPS